MDEESKELVLYEGMRYKELEEHINKLLNGEPFEVKNGALYYITNKGIKQKISNFIMLKVARINYIEDFDKDKTNFSNGSNKFEIAGILLDRPQKKLEKFIIDSREYGSSKFLFSSSWSDDIQISPNNTKGNIEKIKAVETILSRDYMKIIIICTSAGFYNINDKKVFLYNEGHVGDADNIQSQLEGEELQMYKLTDKEFDVEECLKLTLGLLDVAKHSITIPLMAITFYAPLYSILAEEGIPADFILHVYGRSQSGKSCIVACFLNHYGADFYKNKFPGTFEDTINNVEKKLHILKDLLFVCDDLNPSKDDNKIKLFEKLTGKIGDRGGKGRMRQDGTLRETYNARCMCVTTGEIIPDLAESRLARTLIVEITKGDIDFDKLTIYQEMINREKATYTLKNYIQYIIDNEEELIELAKKMFNELRAKGNDKEKGRIYDSGIIIQIGFSLFLKFMNDYNIISIDEKESLEKKCHEIVTELLEKQRNLVESEDPADMFINAVETMLINEEIYVKDAENEETIGNPKNNSKFVGFYDYKKNEYWFLKNEIYGKVLGYYSNAHKEFPIKVERTLWDYLSNKGLLRKRNDGRADFKRMVRKKPQTVVIINLPDMPVPNKHKQGRISGMFAAENPYDTF